ncbi:MAG: S8 family serine peptidase, partial [Lachnospiraceae bacterium]|nr:S8 family serine peptidase [Lachnospiraceae bacterium]
GDAPTEEGLAPPAETSAPSAGGPGLIPHVDDVQTIFEERQITAEDLAALERLNSAKAYSEAGLAALADGSASAAMSDTGFSQQWYLPKIGLGGDAAAAGHPWQTSAGAGVTVAVIDSGIAKNHPDLKGNIDAALNACEFAINGSEDNHGHGTHVAGIIAAVANNNRGVAGIAPGAKIVSIKAFDYQWYRVDEWTARLGHIGTTADIVRAVNMAVSRKADVINMSHSAESRSPDLAYQEAVGAAIAKGIVVVAAAGNDGTTLSATAAAKVYPAQFAAVIAVSAATRADGIAADSNRGAGVITLGAPGEDILSTYLNSGYAYMSGTSMASPVVAGAVALVLGAAPAYQSDGSAAAVASVTALLKDTATKTGDYAVAANFGSGLVNAAAALAGFSEALPAPELAQAAGSTLTATDDAGEAAVEVANHSSGTVYYYTQDGKTPTLAAAKSEDGRLVVQTNGLKSATLQVIAVQDGQTSPVTKRAYKLETKVYNLHLASATGTTRIGVGKTLTLKPTFTPSKPSNTGLTWRSDNEAVATVSASGTVTAKSAGRATITAAAKDGTGRYQTIDISVNSLIKELTATTTTDAAQLGNGRYAMSYPANCTYDGVYRITGLAMSLAATDGENRLPVFYSDFTFKSSNSRVARVDEYGAVTAVSSGNATITATARDGSGKKASINVNVFVPAEIAAITNKEGQISGAVTSGTSPTVFTVAEGRSLNMSATLAPGSTNKKLVWAAGNDGVVTVNQSGKITGLKAGDATVTVRGADGVNPAWTINIRVVEPGAALKLKTGALSKVTLTLGAADDLEPDNRTAAGSAYKFASTLEGSGAKVVYSSSNEKVARVGPGSGLVTAWGPGTAKITARATDGSGRKVSLSVAVKQPATGSGAKAGTNGLADGKKVRLSSKVEPASASDKRLRWSLSNPRMFTIASNGTIKAKKGASASANWETHVYCDYIYGWDYAGRALWTDNASTSTRVVTMQAWPDSIKKIAFRPDNKASLSITLYPAYSYDKNSLRSDECYDYPYYTEFFIYCTKNCDVNNHTCRMYYLLDDSTVNDTVAYVAWVDDENRIVGGAPGKTTITFTTMDGSNKKAKINVTVVPRPGLSEAGLN